MIDKKQIPDRIKRLKHSVQAAQNAICIERAMIWTAYHKIRKNRNKSCFIQMAEALTKVLEEKTITIYPDELIVGNFTSKRVGGSIYPELHGVPVMLDIFQFSKRKTNPLKIERKEIIRLLKIIPFWVFRFMAFKAYASLFGKIRFIANQLKSHFYLINESGGISHLAPDYKKLITIGTRGFYKEADQHQQTAAKGSDAWYFYESVEIISKGLEKFARRYADLARKQALMETDEKRKHELETIERICAKDMKTGATSFQAGLQIMFFAHIAINLESLDNAICPGRIDQFLYPLYQQDMDKSILDKATAGELISAFCIKLCEIIPVFSKLLTQFHGGMFNGQVITVGGVDENGDDASNELSFQILDVMDELRMRQPNFHARIHSGASEAYMEKIGSMLAKGVNSPALYNDDVIVQTMMSHGYDIRDARNYTAVGCVEPVCQGKSFSSTDAAIFNTPVILELALNQGKRFGSFVRSGVKTRSLHDMQHMADVKQAFEEQLRHMIKKLLKDLQAVETANRKYHPTLLTSMLLEGCLSSGKCSTAGGAMYNFSGIQCVGPIDTGDALYAIEKAVFTDKKMSLLDLAEQLKNNFKDAETHIYLKNLSKFGNDDQAADKWSLYVANTFSDILASSGKNTRGGAYTTGLYSVTAHKYFGSVTSALPHGRKNPEPFASGISPINGMDKKGPTAVLNSINRFDFCKFGNGINLNFKFTPHTLRGQTGTRALLSLLKTYFRRGGMQIQVNVLDPKVLIQAYENPQQYPNLLVRVSGYSAYFNDLSQEMKLEIINRTSQAI